MDDISMFQDVTTRLPLTRNSMKPRHENENKIFSKTLFEIQLICMSKFLAKFLKNYTILGKDFLKSFCLMRMQYTRSFTET